MGVHTKDTGLVLIYIHIQAWT